MGTSAPAMAPPVAPPKASAGATSDGGRLRSLDVVRGIACVLMAIDHVRVYSGVPAGGPTADIFLTRWVTHFVAPTFCLFAGTGAFFLGRKLNDPAALRRFLVTRGLMLVLFEMTLIRFAWGFSVGTGFMLAGVIWMLGWCMVLLGLVVSLPPKAIGWAGVGIVMLQQLFNFVPRAIPAIAEPWAFVYGYSEKPPYGISVLYVIVPWIGVMMAGYGFGLVMARTDAGRDRLLTRLGVTMTLAWVVIGTALALANAGNGEGPPTWMRVLNQQKYPASQLFLLMTLGPAIAALPAAAKWTGPAGRMFETFGRVPMAYYIAHIFVIHSAAIIVNRHRLGEWSNAWYGTAPYTGVPREARWSLGLLYVVWAACVALLYPVCLWYAGYKRRNPGGWRQYI